MRKIVPTFGSSRWMITVVVATSLAMAAPGQSAPRTESQRYLGGGTVAGYCRALGTTSVGTTCFYLLTGDSSVTITIADDHVPWAVGGYYRFRDQVKPLAEGFFCGSTGQVPVPTGTVDLIVYPATVLPITACRDVASPGTATTGVVTVTFGTG